MSTAAMIAISERMEVIQGDITQMKVDAIVNAADEALLEGGGVSGAIHVAAGPELLIACRKLNGCETGQAKITQGYRLPAKYVIHTVGPRWHGGKYHEGDLLASCYVSSLQLAKQHECRKIAFPAISCGVYGFPVALAAEIAIYEVSEFLKKDDFIQKVFLVCFDEDILAAYQDAWQTLIVKKLSALKENLQNEKVTTTKNPMMERLLKDMQKTPEKKKSEKDRFFRS
jgi:O-acetyl-ADP-ribose deacetylase (regulator of RNase III)